MQTTTPGAEPLPPRPAPAERLAMREPLTPLAGAPWRPVRRVRRPGVGACGEQVREEQRDHDLPRELCVRAVTGLESRDPGEHRAGFVTHLCQQFYIRRIPLHPPVASVPGCSTTPHPPVSPARR